MAAPASAARSSGLVQAAAAWLFLATLDLALHVSIPGAGLLNGQIPFGARVGFAALGLLALLVGVIAVVLLVRLFDRLQARADRSAPRHLVAAARGLLVGLPALIYGASWAAFWNTGTFLDGEGLVFWLAQPIQIFHWIYPPLVVGLAMAISLVAIAAVCLAHAAVRQRQAAQRDTVFVAGGIAVMSLVLSICSGAVYGWSDLMRPTSPYAVTRAAHAGPIVHALLDAQRRVMGSGGETLPQPGETKPSMLRRPVVSMERYLAAIEPARRRPLNVVMVQVESLRSDQLRAYGGSRDVMPILDALAHESRIFTNAYVQASHSNYADLVPLSSQYPLRSPTMYTYPEHPAYPRVLVYDVLKALGYRTGIFSSQNEGWGGMINYHRPSALDRFFHAQTFGGPTYTPWEDAGFAEWVRQTGAAGSVDDRYTVGEAMRWIDTVGSQPFFLHMNLQSSHLPYVVPAEFRRRFGAATLDFTIMWGRFPLDRVDAVKDRYADSLFYADTQIGRLFDHLRTKGLWDNTIIVIGGDNGEAFFEHGFAAHASWLFNEVVKVPMLIRAPGLSPGRDGRPAMFLDVPPSLFDLLGLPSHPGFQGVSLLAPDPDISRSMFMIAQTPTAYETAIVRGRYKLHFAELEKSYFLNDLASDPGETTDLGPRLPDVVADLKARLHRWREAQLAYYADVVRQRKEYPPVIVD